VVAGGTGDAPADETSAVAVGEDVNPLVTDRTGGAVAGETSAEGDGAPDWHPETTTVARTSTTPKRSGVLRHIPNHKRFLIMSFSKQDLPHSLIWNVR
jgi:hypothetical protein